MATVILIDLAEPVVLAAAKQGLLQFATYLCLQQEPGSTGAAPPPRPTLGLCNLSKPAHSPKPVLQVRYRPGPFVLRDFLAAVGRLAHTAAADGGGNVSGATAAAALQQLVSVVAQDAACAAAGGRKSVLYLTDAMRYEPEDFGGCLEMCRSKGVHVELMFLDAGDEHTSGNGNGSNDSAAAEALAAAWQPAEAAFPHLSVTVVRGACKATFDALGSALLQRCVRLTPTAVSLQFKQPLVGALRSLPLACSAEVRPLEQAVSHALLCPCHQAPACMAAAGTAATCSLSGAPLDTRLCRSDERTVVVGRHLAGALHLAAPFNIASLEAGGGSGAAATLHVVARVKAEEANPALLFGVPMLLEASVAGQQSFKVVSDGEMVDVSTGQLLSLLCSSLSGSGEILLATSYTDLESGRAGLFRLHYLLMPCNSHSNRPPALCAKRVACAEELLAPMLPALSVEATAVNGAGSEPPAAVVEAVAGQLARVPLQALDPLALSSRCNETVEMLVRESQPMPKPQATAAPAAAAHTPAPAQLARPATVPPSGDAGGAVETAGQGSGRGRRVAEAGQAGRKSGGQAGASERKLQGGGSNGKGALELRRTGRR